MLRSFVSDFKLTVFGWLPISNISRTGIFRGFFVWIRTLAFWRSNLWPVECACLTNAVASMAFSISSGVQLVQRCLVPVESLIQSVCGHPFIHLLTIDLARDFVHNISNFPGIYRVFQPCEEVVGSLEVRFLQSFPRLPLCIIMTLKFFLFLFLNERYFIWLIMCSNFLWSSKNWILYSLIMIG